MCAGLHLGGVILSLGRIGRSGHLQSGLKQPGLLQRTVGLGRMGHSGPATSKEKTPQTAQLTRDKSLPHLNRTAILSEVAGLRLGCLRAPVTWDQTWIQPRQLDQNNDFRKWGRGRLH
ncbi:putative palmitoyltransferase ZDHHC16 [Platysternon megacephalum]|uniref:Putative palmitoyltransferase ZDHHC16 n=1 Tax=Platysternon megacephalum TaxID=55544 RepID=A0A4D9EGF1_9SAUR|nr:putative palmitoyltransferase ZDHHC16 [Platysternon megacephalum]